MFKEAVYATPFYSGNDSFLDRLFPRITGDSFGGADFSFVSTLRAMLAPRIGNDFVAVRFNSFCYDSDFLTAVSDEFFSYFDGRGYEDGTIYIQSFLGECREALFDRVTSNFEKFHPGFSEVTRVEGFFRKIFKVKCFINPDKKKVTIFTTDFSMAAMHYLQCGIIAFLPWYFNKEDGITEDEMELMESLRCKTNTRYIAALAKIYASMNLEEKRVKALLTGFETSYEKEMIEEFRNDLMGITETINRLMRSIGENLGKKAEKEIMLLGLEQKVEESSGESELADYFCRNKKLKLENVEGTRITFVVNDYLEYWDEELADSVISRQNSYVYAPNGRIGAIPQNDIALFAKALFIDQSIRLRMCAAYHFNINGRVVGLTGYTYPYTNYSPNPHIDGYACLGNYSSAIAEYLIRRDYIGALEQCVASCQSLNLGDSAVMNEFFDRVHKNEKIYVELPDGTVCNPKEAIAWLKKKEEEGST